MVCCVPSQRCIVDMAEQQVDGPPNKKQKVGSTSTPTDNEGMYYTNFVQVCSFTLFYSCFETSFVQSLSP